MFNLIHGLFWAIFASIMIQPLFSQNVGPSESNLIQSNPGERLSLEMSCNPRNLDAPSQILTDIDDLDGIYELVGFGYTAGVSVLGGTAHHFARTYNSIYSESIPKGVMLEAVRDGIRLGQHELNLWFVGDMTGYRIERRYPQGVINVCSFMAALCEDRDYVLACGSTYVKSDAEVLIEKLSVLIQQYQNPTIDAQQPTQVELPPIVTP